MWVIAYHGAFRMTQTTDAAPLFSDLRACLDDDLAAAVAELPEGWWWSGGVCSVSCHASIGPDRAYVGQPMLNAFDDGFHVDLAQPATLAQAVKACIAQAKEAIVALRGKAPTP